MAGMFDRMFDPAFTAGGGSGFTSSGDPFGDYARRTAAGEPFVQSNRAGANMFDEQIKRGFGAAPEPAAAPRPTAANIPPATGPEDAAIRRRILEERARQLGIGTQGATATPRPAVSGPGIGASPTAIGTEAGKTAAKGFGARVLGLLASPLAAGAGLMTASSSAGAGSDVVIDQTTGKPFPRGIPLDPGLVERTGIPTNGSPLTPDQIAALNMTGRSGTFRPDTPGRGADITPVTQAELDMGERNYQTAMKDAAPAVAEPKGPVMPTFGGNFADVPKFLAELGAYGAAIGDKRTAAKTARAIDLKTIEAEGKAAEARVKAAGEARPFTVKGLTGGETVVQGNRAYSLDEKGKLVVNKVPATRLTLQPGLDPTVVQREAETAVRQGNISKAAINQALKDNGYNFQVK